MKGNKMYAHSLLGRPLEEWQPLEEHLANVARLASEFAAKFDSADWAWNAGWLHDIGKYSIEYQNYLERTNDINANIENSSGKIDHSTAGAKYAVQIGDILGHLLAYAIAGHHSGLLNGRDIGACQERRLLKDIFPWENSKTIVSKFIRSIKSGTPIFLKKALEKKEAFSVAFFVRMIFSCLVDADFLDTEALMNPQQAATRIRWPENILEQKEKALTNYIVHRFGSDTSLINRQRSSVRKACLSAAKHNPGFFSLTVPTGGGKTLASLAFALKHAIRHGLERIIYVIPLTSIIEQNADVFRNVFKSISTEFGFDTVLEHHSNFDPEKETAYNRLAAENWDAPLIVTTAVQFYESLFSNKTSRCRKLHRMARSVIILDEAQTLPVDFLLPCLRVLMELSKNYGSTVVLCTATQPAINKRDDFSIGLSDIREIIPDPIKLFNQLKRVKVEYIGNQNDKELSNRIKAERQALCIVNTKSHARILFTKLGGGEGNFHLSGNMCPAHRSEKLKEIRKNLKEERECRVLSTQVIEAGVDVDFPVVYRSLAGVDSIAQAAGRCNRDGKMLKPGHTYIFRSEHTFAERFFADTASCAGQILSIYEDPLDLKSIEHYFRLYFWDQSHRWDSKNIMDSYNLIYDRIFPFNFRFSKVAEDFQLIDDSKLIPVIIPWRDRGMQLCDKLQENTEIALQIRRELQRFTVQIPRWILEKHLGTGIRMVKDGIYILDITRIHYSEDTGLYLETEGPGSIII